MQAEIVQAYSDYQFHVIYQKVHQFCSIDMSALFLDIIKDRLYTTQSDSLPRRSAQTAMYHILEAMTRWIAPILTFTAEEIWTEIPGAREESVLMSQWYQGLESMPADDKFNRSYWSRLIELRAQVSRQLEQLRKAGEIGSSLEAVVRLFVPEKLYAELLPMENELRFVFITSEASIHPLADQPSDAASGSVDDQAIYIAVRASSHEKCVRCWHRRADIGMAPSHPEICGRCVVNVVGKGETRKYA